MRRYQKAKSGEGERNRTVLAQLNAEIRREKSKLKAQLPDLVKLSKKKARTGAARTAASPHRACFTARTR